MSSSKIQKLLNGRNLDLQQMSEQTGLSVESIQSLEQRIQEIFAELEKISNALDMPSSDVLDTFSIKTVPFKAIFDLPCKLFPNAPDCK